MNARTLKKQKSTIKKLRVALLDIKVAHINRQVSLPPALHAKVENVLADTEPRQAPSARKYVMPKFQFREHKTPEAAALAFFTVPGEPRPKLKDIELGVSDGMVQTGEHFVAQIRSEGLWGFVETGRSPPRVNFWNKGEATEEELTHFFAHEMGHCVGMPEQDGWPEENRAEDYGFVAVLANKAARRFR